MTRTLQTLASLALAFGLTPLAETQSDIRIQPELTEALAISKRFADTLKPELKSAMESGGPIAAVETCSERAPQIASQLASETGWTVRRVSLQPRSPQATPDPWERQALRDLAQRAEAEDSSDTLVVSEASDDAFRFMKAQLVEPLCLVCHGKSIAPELERVLRRLYPNDEATGYELGQIRGAISLSKAR